MAQIEALSLIPLDVHLTHFLSQARWALLSLLAAPQIKNLASDSHVAIVLFHGMQIAEW